MHAKLSGKLQARPHYVDEVYRILLESQDQMARALRGRAADQQA